MRAKLPQASTGIWFLVGVVSTLVATRMLSGTPTADDVDAASEVVRATPAALPAAWSLPTPVIPEPAPQPVAEAPVAPEQTCGFSEAGLAADQPYGLHHLPPGVRSQALDALEARMLSHADAQVRAAGLLIGARARGGSPPRVDQLARLASVSQDPVVYAIALEGCRDRQGTEAAACSLLSRTQWVRLDADNAQPWLELAAEAREWRDAEGEAEAMRRAARARRSDGHPGLLPALVDRALDPGTPALQRTLAVSASWMLQAAWTSPHTSQAHAYCMSDLGADAERRSLCHALAETLAWHGTSVADLSVGLAIGAAVGWPASRLQSLQREHDALSEAAFTPLIGADLGCEAIDRLQAWTREVGRHGELQAMRQVLARSGRSIDDWSAQHRRNYTLAAETVETATR
jgi:hypothetical protein